MWQQNYTPLNGSLALSALVAAIPIFVLLYLLGVRRKPAWIAALFALLAAVVVAAGLYRMPAEKLASAVFYGAAFGLFPIGWAVFSAILLYRVTLESGKFEIVKDSVGHLTEDRRLQALLIAFAFGAFIEGAAGFGTPVAVAGAMLAGLGFSPILCGGHLPAGEYGAGRVRLDRHSDRDAGRDHRPADRTAERGVGRSARLFP